MFKYTAVFVRRCLAAAVLLLCLVPAAHASSALPVVGPAEVHALLTRLHRPVMLVYWASWCGPCSEYRETRLIPIAANYGKDIVMIGISVDTDAAAAEQYASAHPMPYLPLLASPELRSGLQISSIPTTVLYDAEGKALDMLVGNVPYGRVEEQVRAAIAGARK